MLPHVEKRRHDKFNHTNYNAKFRTTSPVAPPWQLLPLESSFKEGWNSIEFMKIYLQQSEDVKLRLLFQKEMMLKIDDFQTDITKQYTAIFKDAFPRRENEPFGLTDEQKASTRERVQRLIWHLDEMILTIKCWANRNGMKQYEVSNGIAEKGEQLWNDRFQSLKETIDKLLLRYSYKGKHLQYVGSLNHGMRGAHKGRTAFNINDFDVDLFVVHAAEYHKFYPVIAAEFPGNISNGKIFPIGTEMGELVDLSREVGNALMYELRDKVNHPEKFVDGTEIVLREWDAW
ncbi:uncharacterized protein ATNIH1004_003246 [Aspergillus tanneri]|uniref:Uncharacterized protein n=1 Tax=Aspergillus tanneri TaxID=1220188 RepID=A0A5M9N0T3_9EURO|nr:uncharacterized protein ATNIH1004_003246 [Aspergillus tanneri]KAA8650559.1 hypothetical protein ATNIH1004_003246 [Aspergillus tanneri]